MNWFEKLEDYQKEYIANHPEPYHLVFYLKLGFSFEKIQQPMAGALFNRDLIAPPRVWAEKIYNIVQWNTHQGGHFAALEQPETLSKDIISFLDKLDIS